MSQNVFDRDRLADYGKRGLGMGLSTLSGFQKFLVRGNVVDLAVGVVIGAAFNSVVQGVVKDIIDPLIGKVPGVGTTLANKSYHGFLYGDLISVLITFLITAAVVYFFVVKPISIARDRYDRLHHRNDAPVTRDCPYCMSTVNIQATRCAYCTSPLPPVDHSQVNVAGQR
ncbi:large-conductance mechanosensitive channel [Ktedonobacteria bacterium brp13]|nr:large-conductance mechanosensitive channel [Ktedonobacteria bacterium brp13]